MRRLGACAISALLLRRRDGLAVVVVLGGFHFGWKQGEGKLHFPACFSPPPVSFLGRLRLFSVCILYVRMGVCVLESGSGGNKVRVKPPRPGRRRSFSKLQVSGQELWVAKVEKPSRGG